MKKMVLFLAMAITFVSATGQIVKYVDLGLSVKWADRNVGASSPSDYGDLLEWGALKESQHYAKVDFDISGNPQYDAATAAWGDGWRLPTKQEMEELVEKCKWEWTTQGGHSGYRITGPNGNSIFLPAAGWRLEDSEINYDGVSATYWSSTPDDSYPDTAYNLFFNIDEREVFWTNNDYGRCVRPVCD